jgi:hypothetical protein
MVHGKPAFISDSYSDMMAHIVKSDSLTGTNPVFINNIFQSSPANMTASNDDLILFDVNPDYLQVDNILQTGGIASKILPSFETLQAAGYYTTNVQKKHIIANNIVNRQTGIDPANFIDESGITFRLNWDLTKLEYIEIMSGLLNDQDWYSLFQITESNRNFDVNLSIGAHAKIINTLPITTNSVLNLTTPFKNKLAIGYVNDNGISRIFLRHGIIASTIKPLVTIKLTQNKNPGFCAPTIPVMTETNPAGKNWQLLTTN